MSLKLAALLMGLVGAIGIGLGYYLRFIIALGRKGSMELEIKERLSNAETRAKEIVSDAEATALETLKEARKEIKEKEEKFEETESRLIKKEDLLDRRQTDIDAEAEEIKKKSAALEEASKKLETLEEEKRAHLERISKMNPEEARQELFALVEKQAEEDLWIRTQKAELQTEGKLEERARSILATTIQRLATAVPVDMLSTTIAIPSDEIKGKIIGKEGRNIKAFERVSGVELIIDDTPGAITISSFDPIRREVAANALRNLITDGRIQPAKIEEFVERARVEINKIFKEKGSKQRLDAENSISTHVFSLFLDDFIFVRVMDKMYSLTRSRCRTLQGCLRRSLVRMSVSQRQVRSSMILERRWITRLLEVM